MMRNNLEQLNYPDLVQKLLENLPSRNKDVVERRFGIGYENPHTLEAIGQKYGITRERVRQIEASSLDILKREEHRLQLEDAFRTLAKHVRDNGHIVREERLLENVANKKSHPYLVLILTLGDDFVRHEGMDEFHPLWTTDADRLSTYRDLARTLVRILKKENRLFSENEFLRLVLDTARDEHDVVEFSKPAAYSFLDASRLFRVNSFGEWGLVDWVEVTPRGMRDKAFIVMKREGKPLHFRNVADLINHTDFSRLPRNRKAHPQTVHNELIKDDRFVLIGRGIYALKDWGYEPGTVKDVISSVLSRSSHPLSREEVVEHVLKQRNVKLNTILLNLQDKSFFARDDSGRYLAR